MRILIHSTTKGFFMKLREIKGKIHASAIRIEKNNDILLYTK